jgi:regulator of sigma E protease
MSFMVLLTAVVFVVMLLVLVLVHEWGHFIMAKKAGCNVEEFGFGFPPRLFSIVRGGTRYSLNLLPIGGFVKIEGENMDDPNPAATNFAAKSAAWRVGILAAGVFMNVVLAIVLLAFQAGIGTPTVVTDTNAGQLKDLKTYITDISPNSPASEAGIIALDRIVQLDGTANPTIQDIQKTVKNRAGQAVTIEVERQGQHKTFTVTPRENPPAGQGALGVSLLATGLEKVAWWQAPWAGLVKTWNMAVAIVTQFWALISQLIHHGKTSGELTGPIGLVVYTNEVTKLGLSYFLEFAALISLNLAIINILPFPALDGGRIMFVLLEKVFGRPSIGKIEQISHTVGFGALILLMLVVTFRDIHRFFF